VQRSTKAGGEPRQRLDRARLPVHDFARSTKAGGEPRQRPVVAVGRTGSGCSAQRRPGVNPGNGQQGRCTRNRGPRRSTKAGGEPRQRRSASATSSTSCSSLNEGRG